MGTAKKNNKQKYKSETEQEEDQKDGSEQPV